MPQGTAGTPTVNSDHDAAHSVVMAALGQADGDSDVDEDASSDTDATETAADDVEDSDESADDAEESTEESTELASDDAEEDAEAKGEDEEDLFTAADKAALAKAPKEIQRLAKSLRRSYSEKTTAIAQFQKSIQGNPQEVLQRLAEANGLKVSFGDKVAALAAPADAKTTDAVAAAIEAQRQEWLPILGEGATNAMLKGIQRVAEAITGSKVEPIVQGQTARERAAAQEKVNSDFDRFTKEHPDWKAHESKMLAQLPNINPDLDTYTKTKLAYDLATRDKQVAKAKSDGKLETKIKKAAADAEPAPRTRVPGSKVKAPPPVYKSSRDAIIAAMAEQGHTIES